MSDPERRGRRLFFVIAAVLLLDSLSPLLLQFWLGFANVAWFRQVILPLIRAAAFVWLWQGERFLVWPVAVAAVVSGLGDLIIGLSIGAFVLIPLLQVGGPAAAGLLKNFFGGRTVLCGLGTAKNYGRPAAAAVAQPEGLLHCAKVQPVDGRGCAEAGKREGDRGTGPSTAPKCGDPASRGGFQALEDRLSDGNADQYFRSAEVRHDGSQ